MGALLEKTFKHDPLWRILVETVKSIPDFEVHLIEVRDKILPRKPDISAEELSRQLSITLGEALVILDELRKTPREVEEELSKPIPEPGYELAAIGGTFSRPHYGHLMLILMGLRFGKRLLIGVTTDELAKRLGKRYPVPSFEERVQRLKSVLRKRGWIDRCTIIPLNDPYGPTIIDPSIRVLITSPFTYFRGLEINEIRSQKGLDPLRIFVCPLVVAWDGKPISSTRIFLGEVDERGNVLSPR